MSHLPRDSRGRLKLLGIAGLVLVLGLGLRLSWIQILERAKYEAQCRDQHIRRERLLPHRGRILDRNGLDLAYTVDNPILVAEPAKLESLEARRRVARVLSPLLEMSEADLLRLMSDSRRPTVRLNVKPTPVLDADLRGLRLPGITLEREPKRVYPLGAAAAHVTGFVGVDQEGIEGTERAFDTVLQGMPGYRTVRRDALGGRHAFGFERAPVPGDDLVLTIDAHLQEIVATRLADAVVRCNAKGGWAIALDPRTGDILAMVNHPTYDPTFYEKYPVANYRNHLISDRIEPGSTIKAVTTAAALEEGVMRPETLINCMNGSWMLHGKPITDHEHFGTLTFLDTFVHSSNIAMAQVGLKLGPERMYHYLKKFGFGQKAGLGLPGEDSGYLKKRELWTARSAATMAFGYEIQVTALQLAMAYAALANDGILMKPRLVKQVLSPEGTVIQETRPEQVRRVVTSRTARRMLEFMGQVVTDGTGKQAALDWCVVGGKTGTARKLDPVTKRYVSKHYASFIGVAPLDNPGFLCYVVLDEPKGNIYGGSTAAPAFKEILEAAALSPHPFIRPDFEMVRATAAPASAPAPAAALQAARWIDPEAAAAESLAAVAENEAAADSAARADSTGSLVRVEAGPAAPDLIGLSLRMAIRKLDRAGLDAVVSGSGVVVRQFPGPGVRLTGRDKGRVLLFLGDREELAAREAHESR